MEIKMEKSIKDYRNNVMNEINERIKQSYQNTVWEKSKKIINYLRLVDTWTNRIYQIEEIEKSLRISYNCKDYKPFFVKGWGRRDFADPETSLHINTDLINSEIAGGVDISPLISISWEDETVYSGTKLERIGIGLPLIPIPKRKPKVKIYRPCEWENRLNYLADTENLDELIENHRDNIKKILHQREISELKSKYSLD